MLLIVIVAYCNGSPESSARILAFIGIVVFIVLAIVCYNLASGTIKPSYDAGITELSSKLSGAGLMVMYVLVIVAGGAALVGEITRVFK